MKSNEEYLDELLKSMTEDTENTSTSALDVLQEEDAVPEINLDAEYGSEFEDEADFMAKLLQADDISELDLEMSSVENGSEVSKENDMAEIEKALEELNGSEDEPALSQLEEYTSEMNAIEDDSLSEEDIEALLNAAAKNDEPEEEPVSFDPENEEDLAEIEALLEMSDNGEIVDESSGLPELQGIPEDVLSELETETDGVQELDMDELDALLSLNNQNEEPKPKAAAGKAEKKPAKEKKAKKEKKEKVPKEGKGKGGLFSKIFSVLVEEVPEEGSDKGALNLSDENKEILEQIDREDSKIKVKDKKEKKEKKKKEKAPKEKKQPKEKKPKKVKEPKPPKEKLPEIPQKKLPKRKVRVTFIFGFSVLAAILLIETLIPPLISVSRARTAYDKGEYAEAYQEYYGLELSEEDEKQFQAATSIMQMQSNLDGYNSFVALGNEIYALHSLLEAVRVKNTVLYKAEEYGVQEIVLGIYNEILTILSEKYQLSEEDAATIVAEKSDVSYTKKLQSVVGN